jgi:DNA-binding NarL/FixJ family response regulator
MIEVGRRLEYRSSDRVDAVRIEGRSSAAPSGGRGACSAASETAQELQIAELARDGLSDPEIGRHLTRQARPGDLNRLTERIWSASQLTR